MLSLATSVRWYGVVLGPTRYIAVGPAERFGVGVGIFICSLAGQACLPVLYDKVPVAIGRGAFGRCGEGVGETRVPAVV